MGTGIIKKRNEDSLTAEHLIFLLEEVAKPVLSHKIIVVTALLECFCNYTICI